MSPYSMFLALGLAVVVNSRALNKRSIEWDPCLELNQNITALLDPLPTLPFECAKLSVPLDYTDPESGPLELDLFRVQATEEPVLGTILFNPGGPGGTGAQNLPSSASDLRAIVGEQYHLLSWDPRGTGNTIPFVCNTTASTSTNQAQKRAVESLASPNVTELFLNGGWQEASKVAESCFPAANSTGRYIGTAFVARDMVEIVDALCEDGLLRYYGVSYGTVLGSYFATMFPDRVGRMVLDGNLDPSDYRAGHWGDNLHDTDKTFAGFLQACLDNKEECALATFIDANSTQDLLDAVNLLVEPLAAGATTNGSTLAHYTEATQVILSYLYWPAQYPALASTIVESLNMSTADTSSSANSSSATRSWTYGKALDAGAGIRSADATWHVESAEEYLPQLQVQIDTSPDFAYIWYSGSWIAAQWPVPAKERYYGEFKAKTKHPILYVNGEHDPVTPLVHAQRASKGFADSVVLAHNGYGHTVLADPSTCVHKYVQAYFKNGTLPEPDTHCESDLGIWELAKARNGLPLGALPPP